MERKEWLRVRTREFADLVKNPRFTADNWKGCFEDPLFQNHNAVLPDHFVFQILSQLLPLTGDPLWRFQVRETAPIVLKTLASAVQERGFTITAADVHRRSSHSQAHRRSRHNSAAAASLDPWTLRWNGVLAVTRWWHVLNPGSPIGQLVRQRFAEVDEDDLRDEWF